MLLYDVPSNRFLAVQVSFLRQKSRGKVQSALGDPERADRLSVGMVPAARDVPDAHDGSNGSDGSDASYGSGNTVRYGNSTVQYNIVRYVVVQYDTVRYLYGTVRHLDNHR